MPWKQQRPDGTQGAMTLRDAVNNIFDESFWDPMRLFHEAGFPSIARDVRFPSFDIAETDTEYRIVADVPGYDPKNLSVQMENDTLTIRGSMEEEKEDAGTQWHRREALRGNFVRRIVLPQGIDQTQVTCRMKNGKLSVTAKKSAEQLSRAKALPIETE